VEIVAAYALATLVQSPLLLALALPWLLASYLVARIAKSRVTVTVHTILWSGVAAVGLTPAYGFHLSMLPAYVLVVASGGEGVSPSALAGSYIATWLVVFVIGKLWAWRRRTEHKHREA
jgi:hypothetical protein